MYRVLDVIHFVRQIFFPNWKEDRESAFSRTAAALALFLSSKNGVSTLFSILVHIVILAVLSLIILPKAGRLTGIDVLSGFSVPAKEAPAEVVTPLPQNNSGENESKKTAVNPAADKAVGEPVGQESGQQTAAGAFNPVPVLLGLNETKGSFSENGGFGNRNAAGRQAALAAGDSSPQGENAVEAALEWLAAHQQADGGWSLNFADSCRQCSHSSTSKHNRRTAATALALLPFLGAGYTHQEERYRKTVERGLLFLIKDPNAGLGGVQLQSDTLQMYSRGLAAIALCEGYAMSKPQRPDSALGSAAQRALLMLEDAQDPDTGGWRYRPQQTPGDTSVFAWQLMALKSGKIGGLDVSQATIYAAQDFLSTVSLDGGRRYNYLPNGNWDEIRGVDSPMTCTAIGLLMRMYLGWKPGDRPLDEGIDELHRKIRQNEDIRRNLYFSYYAGLVFNHYGGEHYKTWRNSMSDFLVRTQSRQGHEAGSWYFQDPYSDLGGRLLNTALGAMILETPYRLMPLYRKVNGE